MLGRIAVLVTLLSLPCSFSFADIGPPMVAPLSLCPQASHHKSIKINGQLISTPEIIEEGKLLAQLRFGDKNESLVAAISLAMGGNLKAFSVLLEERDVNLLRMYASSYQNLNGSRCVDPFVEKKVIELFDDPDLQEGLLSFFGKNFYQTRELFDKLSAQEINLKEIRLYTAVIRALVATNQPGIEEALLKHARQYIADVDVKYWHNFMPIDKYYLDFLIQRYYKPVVPLMQDILDETHYSNVSNNTQRTHVYNRQRGIYYQLDKLPSYLVEAIFAEQLSKLKEVPREKIFFNIELEYAAKYALKHALSIEGRYNITAYLIWLLTTHQVTDPNTSDKDIALIEQKMRSHAIEYLAQAATLDTGRILVDELNLQLGIANGRSSFSLISHILTHLSALPASIGIDIPQFMKAVYKLDKRTQLLIVPNILAKHPHPEGHAFLLSQLQYIAMEGESFRKKHGIKSRSAFKMIFDVVIKYDAADYLFLTRDKIDKLFAEEILDEKFYISYSKRLNTLISNESPTYTKFHEKKTEEEKEARQKKNLD